MLEDIKLIALPWKWDERRIYCRPSPRSIYAIARRPLNIADEQWNQYAEHICKLHNDSLEQ